MPLNHNAMTMQKVSQLTLLTAALALGSGCNVEERMWWSSDGARAAVRTASGLCLASPDGTISQPLTTDVVAAAWVPGNRGIVVVRKTEVSQWSAVLRLVPAAEVAQAEALAKVLPDMVKSVRNLVGDNEEALDEKLPDLMELSPHEIGTAALLCLRDKFSDQLQEAVKGLKSGEKLVTDLGDLKTPVFELAVIKLAGQSVDGEPLIIERTLMDLDQPRLPVAAQVVAYRRGPDLVLVPLDGGGNRITVATAAEGTFDWTPDGRSVAYAVRMAEHWESNSVNLARVERRTVVDAAGGIVVEDPVPLATISSTHPPRVQCLANGKTLVASVDSHFPAAPNVPQETRFYLMDAAGGEPTAIPTEAKALPMELAHFAPSPDGNWIAIVESGSDAVAVLNVATGGLEVVSPNQGWKCRTLPAWRGSGELYFAGLPDTGSARAEWLRWRRGAKPQRFSAGWDETAVSGLLEAPKQ